MRAKDSALYELYATNNGAISSSISAKIYNYMDEYLTYGGYPRVILSQDTQEKKRC